MKLLTVKEVSEIISAKPSTIYAWAEQGLIPCFKLNGLLRFSETDLLTWIKSNQKRTVEAYNTLTGRRPGKGV